MAGKTTYKKEYCQMLIAHMAEGLSFESFAGVIKKTRQCLYEWRERYPEFKEAFELGYCEALLFTEKMSRSAMVGKIDGFNSTVWIFWMKNRFGWVDRVDHKVEANEKVTINYKLIDGN